MSTHRDLLDSALSRLSRRRFLRLLGATAGAVVLPSLLAACGGDDDDDDDPAATSEGSGAGTTATAGTSPTSGSSATSGTTPAAGTPSGDTTPQGELIIGAPQDRHQPDSALPNIGMSIPNPNIFETLVALTHDFKIEPLLAEKWEFVEPNTWRFSLRQGVVFHDGSPFNAEAVAWSFQRVIDGGGGAAAIGPDTIKIIDDYTVEFTPSKQNVRLPLQLTSPRSSSIFAVNTVNPEVRVGTGPFKESEYVKDEQHVVEAFADYWGELPKLSKITFRYMPDPTTRMLALQAGEVDLIYDVAKEAASEVTSMEGMQLITSGVGAYEALSFNIHGEEPYDLGQDPAIREAVATAIDRTAIIDGVWQGNAEINNTMVPEGVLGEAVGLVTGPTYDPERAAQLLEEAGWTEGSGGIREKDGRRLELAMVVGYPSAEIHRPMPELVQAQLKEVGIAMEIIQTPDIGSYTARLESREGDLWAEVGNQVDADPCYLPGALFYSGGGEIGANIYADAFAPGPEFDAHIDECGAATSIEGTQEAAGKAMRLLIDEEHIVIPIAGIFRLYGAAAKVQGFEAHPVQFVQRWERVWVEGD